MVVKAELEKLGLDYIQVRIGEVDLAGNVQQEQLEELNTGLKKAGLALMDDKKSILVEKIKCAIIELVHYSEDQIKVNLSDYLSEKLNYNYTYLANLFSAVKGVSIEKFYLSHKIERVKEITGLSPTHFKMLKNADRGTLDDV